MYIQPAQYLDLTERINILTSRYEKCLSQKAKISEKSLSMQEKIRFLQARVQQLLKQQEREKHGIKQHVNEKAQLIVGHINDKKQDEKKFIEQQINKVRNWSAINTLKRMQDKIMQNKSTSAQKQFYEKVKTLYVIEKRKITCNQIQLFDWISQLVKLKKSMDSDSLGNMSDISKIIIDDEENINKNLKKSQKPGSKVNRKSKQNHSQSKLPVIQQNEGMTNCENEESKKQREGEKGGKIL